MHFMHSAEYQSTSMVYYYARCYNDIARMCCITVFKLSIEGTPLKKAFYISKRKIDHGTHIKDERTIFGIAK